MISVDLHWIANAVSGELFGDNITIDAVSTDTRQLAEGALFIALKGPHFDAHDFVSQALERGAQALLVERKLAVNCPQVVVADTRHALGQLGAAVKAEIAPVTVAITGSSGKTTVKEMVAAILQRQGKVLATAGNFNNDIGVPLTLLRLTREHQFAVIELGANHRGEIGYTSQLVKPQVALINNISPAHVEGFGSVHNIAKAKSEIFRGLVIDGLALTPHASEFHECWVRLLAEQRHQTFGQYPKADIRALDVDVNERGCASFTLLANDVEQRVVLNVPGTHNVDNALAAAAICLELGVSYCEIAAGLASMQGVKGRLEVTQLTPRVRLIDDSYNANVGSTKAALDLLAATPGYRIMVLGDMGELGEQAREYHEEVGAYAITAGIQNLYTLGVLSQSASEVFNGHGGRHFATLENLLDALIALTQEHAEAFTILVKGSRSAHMERVVHGLQSRVKELPQVEDKFAC